MAQRADAADAEMKRITLASRKKGAVMVSLRDEIYQHLGSFGLAESKVVSWMDTGFHPWNRSKTAIIPSKVQSKVSHFYSTGLSSLECSKACAVQRSPGQAGESHEAVNVKIVANCNSQLAPVKDGSLAQFSLTCNHTCQAVRAVIAEVPHPNPLFAPNGNISRAMFESHDPTFGKTIRDSTWFQISHIVEDRWPEIIRVIIEADNIPNSIAEKDTTGTLLWKCHAAITDVFDTTVVFDHPMTDAEKWELIEARVQRSEIGREQDVQHYVAFTKEWSGGIKDPFVLTEFEAFTKSLPEVRDISAPMLGKLAKLDLGAAQGALWRSAVLKVASNPSEKCVLPCDVAAMATVKTRPHVLTANKHMIEARRVVAQAKQNPAVDGAKVQRAMDLLDQRLFKHVMNRARNFKSTNEICFNLFESVIAAGAALDCPKQWQRTGQQAKDESTASKRSIAELAVSGPVLEAVVEALKGKGCELGSQCLHAQSDLPYQVILITGELVKFKGIGHNMERYGANKELSVDHADIGKTFRCFAKKLEDVCVAHTSPVSGN